MKKRGINLVNSIVLSLMIAGILFQYGCKSNKNMGLAPVINGVRDIHPDSSAVSKIGPGQTVVIEGSNLATTSMVQFDGYQASINQTLYTDSTVIATVPASLPFTKVKSDSMNVIHLVTKFGQTTFKFPVLPPPPKINYISDEFAQPGQQITITGNYLYLIKSIEFPGGIKASASTITSAADGSSVTVTVPQGATQSGNITIVTQAGSAISGPAASFHSNDGMLCNFDDVDPFAYWAGTQDNSASAFPDNTGNYGHMQTSSPVGKGDGSWWTDGRSLNFNEFQWIPTADLSNSISNYAFKFEVYVKEPMSNGEIRIVPGHYASNGNFNLGPYVGLYDPWNNSGGNFTTDGWTTVVIPMTDFKTSNGTGDSASSFSDILQSNNGKAAMSIEYVNTGSAAQSVNLAIDNIRLVKVK